MRKTTTYIKELLQSDAGSQAFYDILCASLDDEPVNRPETIEIAEALTRIMSEEYDTPLGFEYT